MERNKAVNVESSDKYICYFQALCVSDFSCQNIIQKIYSENCTSNSKIFIVFGVEHRRQEWKNVKCLKIKLAGIFCLGEKYLTLRAMELTGDIQPTNRLFSVCATSGTLHPETPECFFSIGLPLPLLDHRVHPKGLGIMMDKKLLLGGRWGRIQ